MTRRERSVICLAITLGLAEGMVRLVWDARRHIRLRLLEERYYR